MSEEQNPETEIPITEEMIKEYREKMIKHYAEERDYLVAQKEHEVLLADIEEARLRRMTMTFRMAQMLAAQQPEPEVKEDPVAKKDPVKRELKKDPA